MPAWLPPLLALATLPPVFTAGVVGQRILERARRRARWDAEYLRALRRWNGLVPVWVETEARRRHDGTS